MSRFSIPGRNRCNPLSNPPGKIAFKVVKIHILSSSLHWFYPFNLVLAWWSLTTMTTHRSVWKIHTIRNGNSSFALFECDALPDKRFDHKIDVRFCSLLFALLNLLAWLWVAHESSWLCVFFNPQVSWSARQVVGVRSQIGLWPTTTQSFQNKPVLKTAHFFSGALDGFSSLLEGWWRLEHQSRDTKLNTILIWRNRATIRVLVSQGSAWEGNGERTVKFRRCPAAVKPLLALARVSQNARQSLNRRGSTCFFLMCKLFCTNQFFLHLFSFERITGWASKTDKYF